MKQINKKCLTAAVLPLVLFAAGCQYKISESAIRAVEESRAISRANESTKEMQVGIERERTRQAVYSRLAGSDLAIAVQADAMRDMGVAMAEALAGKDRGRETNYYDFALADSKEINATRRSLGGNVVTAGLGALGIHEAGKTIRAGYEAAKGTYTLTAREGSTASYSTSTHRTDYESKTDSTVVGSGSPQVQGGLTHDQSYTEIHEAAPEAPVAAAPETPVEASP